MSTDSYKEKVSKLIKKAKKKNSIKEYSEFCKSKTAEKNSLSDEEIDYYTSNKKGD